MDTNTWTDLSKEDTRTVKLNACYNTELCKMAAHESWIDSSLILLEATLLDSSTGDFLATFVSWPEPYRYLQWPADTNVSITTSKSMSDEWENTVSVKANYPIKGLWLEPVYDGKETDEEKEPIWEDNMFDLMPETAIKVGVKGLRGRGVKGRWLCDWEMN
jgi:beta-mannosidase